MINFKENEIVLYKGNETKIRAIYNDGTCQIKNPDYEWQDDCNVNAHGEIEVNDWISTYWITVNLNELNKI